MEVFLAQIVSWLATIDPVYAAVAVIAIWLVRRAGWLKLPVIPSPVPTPAPDAPADVDQPVLDFFRDLLKKLMDKARAEGKDPHEEVKRVFGELLK